MKKKLTLILSLFFLGILFATAQTQVRGVVVDESGVPVIGATVLIKGTMQGTVTDLDGNFALTTQPGAKLVVTYVGMIKQEVNAASNVRVLLISDTQALDELVVTALGIKRSAKALGYAVQDVKSEDLQRTGSADLARALQGKVAGVDIKMSSGMPGASSQIVIRGSRSFTGNNTPLYVVDGMPIESTAAFSTGNSVTGSDISNRAIDINPNDIESLNVLKGQAAAALYGLRASNGVVIITTKSGKGLKKGKPVVSINHNTSFEEVSRTPDFQTTWAQGANGKYNPTSSMAWGQKIADLPNDPVYGGNVDNKYTKDGLKNGMFYVPQLAQGGLDPWAEPQVYNNWDDYYQTGYTTTTGINVGQATDAGSYSIGLGNTLQEGIALNTGMNRWNAKAASERILSNHFTVGFSTNFSTTEIDKLSGANDASLAGVLGAPPSYNLKGYPNHVAGDPYSQIYYRSLTFDNPYWVENNNTFNEKTERFFGNTYIQYNTLLSDALKLDVKYQLGVDNYTTHFQDIFGFGSKGKKGELNNYGVTETTYNSLLTAILDWTISDDLRFNALLGNEVNHNNRKTYDQVGTEFNFGGWNHIQNANTVTGDERKRQQRTVGLFANLELAWKEMLYFGVTGRNDIASTMPRGNRSFFYPSTSLGFVVSELGAVDDVDWITFAKVRASYGEVGQAGTYYNNYYQKPTYGGGFWNMDPITYPVNGTNSYISYGVMYDPALKPQNTKSYELGADLKFFNNRFGIDYTYSRQNVTDQIFQVPLAGSTGASSLVMNGGKVHTDSHELMVYVTPVRTKDFTWDLNVNYSKVAAKVRSLYLKTFDNPIIKSGETLPITPGSPGIGIPYAASFGSSFTNI